MADEQAMADQLAMVVNRLGRGILGDEIAEGLMPSATATTEALSGMNPSPLTDPNGLVQVPFIDEIKRAVKSATNRVQDATTWSEDAIS